MSFQKSVPTVIVDVPLSANRAVIRLLNCGEPVALKGISKIDIILPDGTVVSSKDYPLVIRWSEDSPEEFWGLVELFLGELGNFSPFKEGSTYDCQVKIYDPLYPEGIYWGMIRIMAV